MRGGHAFVHPLLALGTAAQDTECVRPSVPAAPPPPKGLQEARVLSVLSTASQPPPRASPRRELLQSNAFLSARVCVHAHVGMPRYCTSGACRVIEIHSRVPRPRPVWHLCCPVRCSHTSPSSPLPLTTAAGSSCPPPARPRRSERAHTAPRCSGPSALACLLRREAALLRCRYKTFHWRQKRGPARLRRRPGPPAAHRAACSLLPDLSLSFAFL